MSCLTKNWKWKIKAQEKFSFLAVMFTFILVCYGMHRKQTPTLEVLSLKFQCLRGIWTMPSVTCFDFWSALKWSGSWTWWLLYLGEKRYDVHVSKGRVIFVISNLPIKWALSKGERIVICMHCMWFFQSGVLKIFWFFLVSFYFFFQEHDRIRSFVKISLLQPVFITWTYN